MCIKKQHKFENASFHQQSAGKVVKQSERVVKIAQASVLLLYKAAAAAAFLVLFYEGLCRECIGMFALRCIKNRGGTR